MEDMLVRVRCDSTKGYAIYLCAMGSSTTNNAQPEAGLSQTDGMDEMRRDETTKARGTHCTMPADGIG